MLLFQRFASMVCDVQRKMAWTWCDGRDMVRTEKD